MTKGKSKKENLAQLLKRNGVVAAVVLFVCVAIYLNWSYNETGKTLGDAALVGAETSDPLVDHTQDDGSKEGAQADLSAAYFANARLNRQQARDSALSMLHQALSEEGADQTVKEQTGIAIETMAGQTLAESQIENLVVAKGYVDCVAFIGQDGVSVVVQGTQGELSEIDTAKIKDIVTQNTSFSADRVKIIEVE